MTGKLETFINADDLGISPGTNHAVREAHLRGRLTHASLMANGDFARDAVRTVIGQCPALAVGLHVNLTYGRPLTACPTLAREGTFRWGFPRIFRRALQGDAALLVDVERELDAQISWIRGQGITLDHINSHHHVHMIPAVFGIVKKLAREHGIPRIRIPDESLALSLRIARRPPMLRNGGLAKFCLMTALVRANRTPANRRFFSLLFTGAVTRPLLHRALQAREPLEVVVHPGFPERDGAVRFHTEEQRVYRCSQARRLEFHACLLSP